MKRHLRSMAAAALGLLLGFLVSRATSEPPADTSNPERALKKPPSRITDRSATREATGGGRREHTLDALFHLDWGSLHRDQTKRNLLAADNETLRQWLIELSDLDKRDPSLSVINLRNRVVREIYHREGPDSLPWAKNLGNPGIFGQFIKCLARDDAMAAAEWFDPFKSMLKHRDESDRGAGLDSSPWNARNEFKAILPEIYQAAIYQGEDIALKLYEILDGDLSGWSQAHSLPEGFDYAKYLGSMKPDDLLRSFSADEFLESWAMQDQDAAFAFAYKIDQSAPVGSKVLLPDVFQGVCKLQGEVAAGAWISERLALHPHSDRSQVLTNLYPYLAPSPTGFRDIVSGLKEESDRVWFASSIIDPRATLDLSQSYLGLLNSNDVLTGAVEASSRHWSTDPPSPEAATKWRSYYEALTSTPDFPDDVRTRVMAMWPDGSGASRDD